MPVITTTSLKPWTAEDLPDPDSLPPRPEDADQLAALLSWAAASVWPDGVQPLPLEVVGWQMGGWPSGHHLDGRYDAWNISHHLLTVLATAEITGRVNPPDESPQGIPGVLSLAVDGYHVILDSWRYLYRVNPDYGDHDGDSADLWRWSWSRRELPQYMATRENTRRLPGALRTAQAIADALYVQLPQAVNPDRIEQTPTPTPRRNTWA